MNAYEAYRTSSEKDQERRSRIVARTMVEIEKATAAGLFDATFETLSAEEQAELRALKYHVAERFERTNVGSSGRLKVWQVSWNHKGYE